MSDSSENISSEIPLMTFNSLYNTLREEKKSQNLIPLPDKFYESVDIFLKTKNDEIKKAETQGDPLKLRKEKNVLKNSIKILTEILVLRSTKIAKISIHNTLYEDTIFDENRILETEKELYTVICEQSNKLKLKTLNKNG